jgi:hypothetical protein
MKNIMVIDGAENCVYDVFAAPDDDFALIFPEGRISRSSRISSTERTPNVSLKH